MDVGDLGISREMCLQLMDEHFNPACEPPWKGDDDEGDIGDRLSTKVNSAYNSRQTRPGADDGASDFADDLIDTDDVGPREEPPVTFAPTPFEAFDVKKIAPRDWLYASHYIRKYVVADFAPGGGGKSSVVLVEAVAMALGRDLLDTGKVYHRRLKVWYWNGEDPKEETERRIAAICIQYKINMSDLTGWLFIDSGRQTPIKIATSVSGSTAKIAKPLVNGLVSAVQSLGIDVVTVDPFVSSHGVAENDNAAIDAVIKEGWVQVAERGNCCVCLVHHTRKIAKGSEYSASDGRGASAMVDAARDVRTFNVMTEKEGDEFGIVADQRWRYIKVASDKPNMAIRGAVSPWRKLESVTLDNKTDKFPADNVGVVVPWLPEVKDEKQEYDKRAMIGEKFLAYIDNGTRITKQQGGDMTQVEIARDMKVTVAALANAIEYLRKSLVIRYQDAQGKMLAGWVRIPRTADTTPVDAYDDDPATIEDFDPAE